MKMKKNWDEIKALAEDYATRNPDARQNCVRLCGAAARIAVEYLRIDEDDIEDLDYDASAIGIPGWTI